MSYDGLANYLIIGELLRSSNLFYRTNILHMTTSVSRRLNILSKMNLLYNNAVRSVLCEG